MVDRNHTNMNDDTINLQRFDSFCLKYHHHMVDVTYRMFIVITRNSNA